MEMIKKSLAVMLAVLCVFSMSTAAFATEPETEYTLDVVFSEIGTSSVTVKKPGSSTYAYGWKAIGAEGDPVWNADNSNVITNLSGSTVGYEIYVKDIKSNEMGKAEVLAAPEKPQAPKTASCTMTTITVNISSPENYEFKCFNTELGYDSDWQESNVLEGLKKDTVYTVIIRNKVADNQLKGVESDGLLVRTAHRDKFVGTSADCRVDIVNEGAVIKGTTIKFSATGSFIDDTSYVTGDVRYVAVDWKAYQVMADGSEVLIDSLKDSAATTQTTWKSTGAITKSDTIDTSACEVTSTTETVTVKVYVTFRSQIYSGSWINYGTYTEYSDFPVRSDYSIWEKIGQFLSKLLNTAKEIIIFVMEAVGKFLTSKSY